MGTPAGTSRVAAALAAALVLASCGGREPRGAEPSTSTSTSSATGTGTGTDAEVTIETFIFGPDPLEIEAGTTVTFRNLDGTVHTVTAGTREEPGTAFDAELDRDETFSRVFDEPGTQDYFCRVHAGEGMTGRIVVR